MHPVSSPWASSFAAIAIVSGIPLAVTLLLALNERSVRVAIPFLTAAGAGALMGAAVLHLIPESLSNGSSPIKVFVSVAIGYAVFALVERLLAKHNHAHAHGIELGAPEAHSGDINASLAPLAFTGDAIHNFVDGVLIAAGFLASPGFGILTAVAIGLHELPREVGTFSLFVHSGVQPLRAVGYNLLTALLSAVGATATLLIGARVANLGNAILPFAAGSYVYISLAIGLPALSFRNSLDNRWPRAIAMVSGFALTSLSVLVR